MENKPTRPPSIWTAQILLVFMGLIVFVIDAITVWALLPSNTPIWHRIVDPYLIISFLVFPAVLAGAFFGLVWRKSFGRWLSVLAISGVAVFAVWQKVDEMTDGTEFHGYDNSAQLIGSIIGRAIVCILLLALIIRLCFSKRVSAFFSGKTLETPAQPPSQRQSSSDH